MLRSKVLVTVVIILCTCRRRVFIFYRGNWIYWGFKDFITWNVMCLDFGEFGRIWMNFKVWLFSSVIFHFDVEFCLLLWSIMWNSLNSGHWNRFWWYLNLLEVGNKFFKLRIKNPFRAPSWPFIVSLSFIISLLLLG